MGSLGIAIDSGRYVRIDSSTRDFYRNVRLRTVSAGQDSAKLNFCTFGRKGPVLRKSVLLHGLSNSGDAPSELRLRVERRGYALWNINLKKPGGEYQDIRVRTGIGLWPLVLLAILLLVLGLWLAYRVSSRADQPASAEMVKIAGIDRTPDTGESEADSTDEEPQVPVNTAENQAAPDNSSQEDAQTADTSVPIPAFPEKTTVIFLPESSVLTGDAMSELDRIAEIMPENISIEIGGHCAIFGTETGRERLSLARAAAVADYFSRRIPGSVLVEIRGYGGSRPITRDLELQDMNRRVEINVNGDNG